jgi:3-phenylpropionate/trans-cinnamate dioxygenase ferredoxin reductase component
MMAPGNRVIILGAGQAGVQAAMSLRQGGYQGEVILAGKEPHVPYQRPPLSKQVLKKEWSAERCQFRHLESYSEHNIDLLLGVAAVRLDTAASKVSLDDGSEWSYDSLVICTGSRLNRLRMEGSALPQVHYIKTLDDALGLSARLLPGAQVAIIGGGYIGLEVAAAARSLGCDVAVIEALDQVMKRSALPEIAGYLHQRHEQEGVTFHMNRKVACLQGTTRVESVELEDGEVIPADVVMVGVGVRPDLRCIEGSGIAVNRGILVDGACRSNVANIFAAGDVAEFEHPLLEGWHVLESVQNAVSQGKVVAAAILGQEASYSDVPWFWSEQYDCRLQMAGIPRGGDQQVGRRNEETGGFSIFSLAEGQLHAVQSINSPRDYMVGRQLIAHHREVSTGVLTDHKYNLKELL